MRQPPSGLSSCMRIWFLNSIRSRWLTLLTFSSVTLINSLPTLTVVPTRLAQAHACNSRLPPAPPVTKGGKHGFEFFEEFRAKQILVSQFRIATHVLEIRTLQRPSIASPSRKPPMAKGQRNLHAGQIAHEGRLIATPPKPPTTDSETQSSARQMHRLTGNVARLFFVHPLACVVFVPVLLNVPWTYPWQFRQSPPARTSGPSVPLTNICMAS